MDKAIYDNILKAHTFGKLSATDYLVSYRNMSELTAEKIKVNGDKIYLTFYDDKSNKVNLTYKDFGKRLNQLANFLREKNIKQLVDKHISPTDLVKKGIHPAFGEVTLAQLLSTWVAHDLGHIAQMTRVMAKQYKEAVGPWKQYLPILEK